MQSARWPRRWGSTRPALRTVVVHGLLLASFGAVAHAQSSVVGSGTGTTPVVAAPPVATPAPLPAGAPDSDYANTGYAGSTLEPTPPPPTPTTPPAWDLE